MNVRPNGFVRSLAGGLIACVLLCAACQERPNAAKRLRPPRSGPLPSGVVARVGNAEIGRDTVAHIAAAQKLSLSQARARAIYDALMAEGARERGLVDQRDVQSAVQRVLARELYRNLWQAATEQPISDQELQVVTDRHWLEVYRPDGYRTIHALVWSEADKQNSQQRAQAREYAEKLREALQPAVEVARRQPGPEYPDDTTRFSLRYKRDDPAAKSFIRATRKVDTGSYRKKVEQLPVISPSGRIMEFGATPQDAVVKEYAEATSQLQKRGDLSPVVETRFGYHVILLLEKIPPARRSEGYRRKYLAEEIYNDRAKERSRELLERLRKQTPPQLDSKVDALLGLVKFDEPKQ